MEIPRFVKRVMEPGRAIKKATFYDVREQEIKPRIPPLGQVLVFEPLSLRKVLPGRRIFLKLGIALRFPSRIIDVFFKKPGKAFVIPVVYRSGDFTHSTLNDRMLMNFHIEAAPSVLLNFFIESFANTKEREFALNEAVTERLTKEVVGVG